MAIEALFDELDYVGLSVYWDKLIWQKHARSRRGTELSLLLLLMPLQLLDWNVLSDLNVEKQSKSYLTKFAEEFTNCLMEK